MTIHHENVQLLPRLPFKYYEHDPLTSINVQPHWHQGIELNFLVSGAELKFVTDGQTTIYQPGAIWAVNRRVTHSAAGTAHADWTEFGLIIDDDFLIQQLPDSVNWQLTLSGAPKNKTDLRAYAAVRKQLLTIRSLIQQGVSDPTRLLIMGQFYQLIATLALHFNRPTRPAKTNPNPNLVDTVMTYIQQHASAELTGAELAQQFRVSLTTLNQQFNANLQMSIGHYIRLTRLLNARRLLLETTDKVTAIASSCGFSSDKTLNRNFKAWKGLTPSEYRQAYARYHQK